MRHIKNLFKKEMFEFAYSFRKKNKKFGILNTVSGLVLTAVILGAFIYFFKSFASMYFGSIFGEPSNEILRIEEILTIAYMAVFLADIVVGVRSIYNALSSSKDMDVLIYQPIGAREIFAYKFIKIYLSQLFSSILIILPIAIVTDIASTQVGGAAFYLLSIMTMILLPLMSCSVAAVFSIPFIAFMRAVEDKFIVKLIIYVAVIGVGFWLYSKFLAILTDLLRTGEIRNAFDLVTINSIHEVCEKLYPGKFFADILITKNVGMNVGILLGISVFGLAASLLLIKVIYDRVIQKRLEGTRKYKFKERKFKARSVVGTLLYKEFVTVLRTPSYAFQYFATAVTLPFMVYVCVNLLRSLMSTLTFYNCDFELAMFVISTFGILTNTFCASNVSRDGGMYAMIKTMPIRCKDYMTAKLVFCGIVSVISSLACSVTLLIAEFLSPWQAAFAFLMGVILSVAEIAFATRKDMKNPTFPKRGETVELNGSTSTLMLLGLVTSLIAGGGAVALNAILSFLTEAVWATLASVGFITLFIVVYAVISAVYFMKGLKKDYYTEGERSE